MSALTHPIFLSIFGAGAALAVLIGVSRWKRWKQRIALWQAFADQRGLTLNVTPDFFKYAAGTLTMQGVYQELPFLLFTEYRGDGDSRHIVTILQLELGEALPPGLTLKPERLGDKALNLLGFKDEEVGDAALDDVFALKNVTPRARALLVSPRVRGPLMRLGRSYSDVSIEAGFLRVEKREMPETAMELDDFMAPALVLARAVRAAEEYTGARMR